MLRKSLLLLFFVLSAVILRAQCLEVLDGNGAFSDNPYFVSCTPGDFTIFIQPDRNIGPYTINWGDGSANSTGATLNTTDNVQHTYTATTDTFNITITDNGSGCTIMGVAVLERNPLASIQLPSGDDNFGCTPVLFRFINSSTQVSETTTFTWDFGDGSPIEVYDYTNLGDTVLHTYLPGVGVQSCNLEVTLTATNYCGSSTASFFPLRVWDLDEAQITPSATLLCYPDTVVQYTNNTVRNCFPEGNQSQRYERWNFGDYWGLGYDSIIDWRPWNPPITPPPPIAYPGVGIYAVTLQDSSFCGIDDVTITIEITNPPTSVITSNKDTICEGENVTFTNASFGGANEYEWNFDRGAGFQTLGGGNKTRTYNNSGDYTIELVVGIAGAAGCRDTSSVDLHVLPSPDADFTFDTNNECDSMTVNFTNTSSGSIVSYDWDFGNGNTFSGISPPAQLYNTPGTYNVTLTVGNSRGCLNTEQQTIQVRETPVADFTVSSVCLNEVANFIDLSTSGGDPITSYQWDFGDGSTSMLQNPTHLYTAFGTYTVTQIVNNGFCSDTATLSVTVENRPTADFISTPEDGCSRLTVSFTNQSSANASTFRWNFGDGSSPVFAEDTSHTYTNNGVNDTTFITQLIATTTFGCSDTTYDTIRVFPVPTPSFTSDAVADCGPIEVSFTNTTQGDSLDFFWNFGDGTGIVNDTNPTHIFDNKTLFINNYNVSLIVESNNGCRDTTTQIVEVYPEPIFTFSAVPDSGCSPLTVNFPSVVGAVNYSWDFGDGSTGSGPTPTHTFINSTTNNQSFTIRLIAQNSFGCADTTFGSVLVFPNPSASFAIDTNVGCQPLPIEVTNNSTGANSFSWDFGDGTNSMNPNATFTKTYDNLTALTQFFDLELIVETDNGCRDTASRRIEVHPFIQASFLSDSVGCSPLAVPFNNQSIGGANFQWNFGDGAISTSTNPSHTYVNSTNASQTFQAQLIAISAQQCADTVMRSIEVYPKPTASYTLSTNQGCQPLQVTFTNSSSLADSCIWNYGDLDTFRLCTPTNSHTYTNTTSLFPIDYTSELIVISGDGCADTLSRVVTVNPQVIASFDSIPPGCTPHEVNLNNQSIGAQTYQWTFGDGATSIASDPDHTYDNQTISDAFYTVNLEATSQYGCTDNFQRQVQVYPKPQANFMLDTAVGCHPFTVNITDNSVIVDSCRWNFGDGSAILDTCQNNFSHLYENTISTVPLNRMLTLFARTDNGCLDTAIQQITVNPRLTASFDSISPGCHPYTVNFNNNSIGADTNKWTFGDGGSSLNSDPIHVFNNTGTTDQFFTINLETSSQYGCTANFQRQVQVYPKPQADFSVDNTIGCHPFTVNITDNSLIVDSCRWNFGDGSAILDTCQNTFSHLYENTISSVPVNRMLTLFARTDNGCLDTAIQQITVNPELTAGFDSIPPGCHPYTVNFNNSSIGADTNKWTFGDGGSSLSSDPTHTFNNLGTNGQFFTISLETSSQYGCTASFQRQVQVYPKPQADFSVDNTVGCHPFTVNITDNSVTLDSCRWDFGDGSAILDTCQNTFSHLYENTISSVPVNRMLRLFARTDNGCLDTAMQQITVNPELTASFDSIPPDCHPYTVNFNNNSIGADTNKWTFGDGGNSFNVEPTHTFNNLNISDEFFDVRLITSSRYGCIDTLDRQVQVFPKPTAGFTLDTTVGCHPFPLNFTDASVIADSCRWDFGDGSPIVDSCFNTLTYTYQNTLSSVPINRRIFQYVYTDNGCTDTVDRIITVNPNLEANFGVIDTGCSPLSVNFRDSSIGVQTYQWTFGDGGSSIQSNPRHTYLNLGLVDTTFTAQLRVDNGFGCVDILSKDILVYAKPTADYTINTNDGCQPLPVQFTNNSTLADNCIWNFGDGSSRLMDCSPTVTHTYTNTLSIVPINYTSQLIAVTNNGCSDTLERSISVRPLVIADFTADTVACSPLNTTFRSQSFGATTYRWNFGDGTIGSGMIISHQYTNTGAVDSIYQAQLIAESVYGCTDDTIIDIRVHPTPLVDFTATPLQQLFPSSTVDVSNTTNTGSWSYEWKFGDSTTSTLTNPGSHTYQTWGNYTIQLKAFSPFCEDSTDISIFIEAPEPVADFIDSASGCEPLEVNFTNQSLYANQFEWDFGDGGTSNSENPTHIYFNEGTYSVQLKVSGFGPGKEDQIVKTDYITVYRTPVAIFTNNRDNVFIPNDPVIFSNFSTDADSYVWDFGDGNSSTERSPTYFYQEEGEFQVYLIANTNEGCADTAFAPTTIKAELEGKIKVPNAFTPSSNGPSSGNNVNRGVPLRGELNNIFYAIVEGSVKYELNIFNKWGELLFVSKDIRTGWDGYYKGELCQQDVYVWKVKVQYADGKTEVKVGDLMLLR